MPLGVEFVERVVVPALRGDRGATTLRDAP
jgi:hypothetical protein